jgi:hypothetical protein
VACGALGIALPTVRTTRKEWRATVKEAATRLAASRLEQRSSLRLFRACEPTRGWLRRWVWDTSATRESPSALLVSLLGGFCRLLPVTRLVRFAPTGQERPHFCDFCQQTLAGDADAGHVLMACPAWAPTARQWQIDVDLAFARTPVACGARAWWQRLRRGPPSHASLAAALMAGGCPSMPRGKLGELRTDLAQAFMRTMGTWVACRTEWIDSLPPARRAPAAGGGARLARAVTIQPQGRGAAAAAQGRGAAAAAGGAALRRASTAPPSLGKRGRTKPPRGEL